MSQQRHTASGTIRASLRGGGLLLLWTSMAWAGVSEEEAAQQVQQVQTELGERILIGAVGPDAERAFARQARMNSSLEIDLVRIPTAGDIERERIAALARAGLRCGMQFSADSNGWLIEPFGDCTPRIEEGLLITKPEVVSTEPTAVVFAVDRSTEAFERRHLELEDHSNEHWDVVDGAHRTIHTPAFASLIKDEPTQKRLALEQQRAVTASRAFRIGGAVVATAGLLPFIGMPSVTTPEGEDRVWTALFLGSTGLLAVIGAPRIIEGVNATQKTPERYYSRTAAKDHIGTYNTALKLELGLQAPQEDAEPDTLEPLELEDMVPSEAPAEEEKAEDDAPGESP